MPDSVHLAELLCARLCHDLAGALGSLTSTLELAETRPGGPRLVEAVAAGEDLTRRIRLLRAAWGGDGGRLDLARLRDLARGVPGGDRIEIDLTDLPRRFVFAPGVGRVVLNLLLLAPETMPRGGLMALTPAGEALVLRIAGTRAAWPAGFAGYLANPDEARAAAAGPRSVLGPWIALLAAHLGVRAALLLPTGHGRGAGPAPLLLQQAQTDGAEG
jgi:histidine phosphotransferase ChpT